MREIKFRAKATDGSGWWFGTNTKFQYTLLFDTQVVRLSEFWHMVEVGELKKDTVQEWVEWTNRDGSKGSGFEGDIVECGGDNHNSVITFGESAYCSVGFFTKESKLRPEKYHRYHGLPSGTQTVKIIGNEVDEPKLKSRWGRS